MYSDKIASLNVEMMLIILDLKHEKRLKKIQSKWSCHTIENGTEFIKNKLENTSIRKGRTFIFDGKGNNIDSKKSLFSNGDNELCKTSDFMVQLDNNTSLHCNSDNDNINCIESNIRIGENELQIQNILQNESVIKRWISDIIKNINE